MRPSHSINRHSAMRHLPVPKYVLALFASAFLVGSLVDSASAQNVVPAPEPRLSPVAIAATKLDNGTYVKIVYGQPQRRDPKTGQPREIFGKLEPYGKVWRLGANEATEITTTGDIEFGGRRLPAGTYSLFAIPERDHWTIIVNKELGQWGAYEYKQESDLFRINVPVETTPNVHDAFTISFDEDNSNLNMVWEKSKVVVPIEPAGSL